MKNLVLMLGVMILSHVVLGCYMYQRVPPPWEVEHGTIQRGMEQDSQLTHRVISIIQETSLNDKEKVDRIMETFDQNNAQVNLIKSVVESTIALISEATAAATDPNLDATSKDRHMQIVLNLQAMLLQTVSGHGVVSLPVGSPSSLMRGIVINRHSCSVIYKLSGAERSYTWTLPAQSQTILYLPPGNYLQEVIQTQSGHKMLQGDFLINDVKNDAFIDGRVYDFSMILYPK